MEVGAGERSVGFGKVGGGTEPDDAAFVHKGDAGAEKHGFVKVVRDEDGSFAQFTDESGEFLLKIRACDGI